MPETCLGLVIVICCGIDPGKGGAIAAIGHEGEIRLQKLDATEAEISAFFLPFARMSTLEVFAVIEKVHAFPGHVDEDGTRHKGQGVVSAFTFGQGYGFLRGLLIAHQIPFEEVSPQKWQKALGCMTRGDKNVSKGKAQQLYPGIKVVHATADALLIAHYCRRIHGGRQVTLPQQSLDYDASEI